MSHFCMIVLIMTQKSANKFQPNNAKLRSRRFARRIKGKLPDHANIKRLLDESKNWNQFVK